MNLRIEHGDCLEVMARLKAEGVLIDAVVTDPPYHLTSMVKRWGNANPERELAAQADGAENARNRLSRGFMGKTWDGGDIAHRPETWRLVFDLMKPGAHLVAFAGTRTYHRMVCAIEDAGFEIRDMIGWLYGSGFPKSHNISKAIDRAAGAEREVVGTRRAHDIRSGNLMEASQGEGRGTMEYAYTAPGTAAAAAAAGWGTALKPAQEPIVLARKPLAGTVAENFIANGTGALNIDACRVEYASEADKAAAAAAAAEQRSRQSADRSFEGWGMQQQELRAADYIGGPAGLGRWPANMIHDGSDEVVAAFPESDGAQRNVRGTEPSSVTAGIFGKFNRRVAADARGDSGSAARFFYSAKADADDRLGSKHPTVKPIDLMAYLVRLVTPPGGLVLDPFAGTGTTGIASLREGARAILIEREAEYVADIRARVEELSPDGRSRDSLKARKLDPKKAGGAGTPLFGEGVTS